MILEVSSRQEVDFFYIVIVPFPAQSLSLSKSLHVFVTQHDACIQSKSTEYSTYTYFLLPINQMLPLSVTGNATAKTTSTWIESLDTSSQVAPLFPIPSPARLTSYIALLTHPTPLLPGAVALDWSVPSHPRSFHTSHLTPSSQERCQQLFPRPGYHAPYGLSYQHSPSPPPSPILEPTHQHSHLSPLSPVLLDLLLFISFLLLLLLLLPFPIIIVPPGLVIVLVFVPLLQSPSICLVDGAASFLAFVSTLGFTLSAVRSTNILSFAVLVPQSSCLGSDYDLQEINLSSDILNTRSLSLSSVLLETPRQLA